MGRFEFMYRPANHTANRCCLHLAFGKADGGDNYCVLVHSSGMRIVVPVEATAINNTMLEMSADEGAVWVLATSASTGQQQCADKQYCLDYTGISEAAYLKRRRYVMGLRCNRL